MLKFRSKEQIRKRNGLKRILWSSIFIFSYLCLLFSFGSILVFYRFVLDLDIFFNIALIVFLFVIIISTILVLFAFKPIILIENDRLFYNKEIYNIKNISIIDCKKIAFAPLDLGDFKDIIRLSMKDNSTFYVAPNKQVDFIKELLKINPYINIDLPSY